MEAVASEVRGLAGFLCFDGGCGRVLVELVLMWFLGSSLSFEKSEMRSCGLGKMSPMIRGGGASWWCFGSRERTASIGC